MKNILFFFLFIISLSINSQILSGKIVRVSDGDTVVLLDSTNTQHKIRLDGIDCPEKGQDYGTKATNFTKELCAGKYVDVDIIGYDRYKRILGVVWIGDVNLNEELLKAGLAWRYKYNKDEYYLELEYKAREDKINIWSMKAIAPWDWRKGVREYPAAVTSEAKIYVCESNPNIYHTSDRCQALSKCENIKRISFHYKRELSICTFCEQRRKTRR